MLIYLNVITNYYFIFKLELIKFEFEIKKLK